MISLRRLNPDGSPFNKREGFFKSYRVIGKYLTEYGETGKYHAIPKNINNIAGIKDINVVRRGPTPDDVEIEMNGSYY